MKYQKITLWKCKNCGKEKMTTGFKPTICKSFGCQFNDNPTFDSVKQYELVIEE